MSNNQVGTFIYSPDISAFIYNIDGNMIDISEDIINFSMDREVNSTSTFTCMLSNYNRKYTKQAPSGNRLINTMDRITVFLKRTNFIQCFTGLITYAPLETLVPTPITINASCTLYILQQTYWDDTLIDYQGLLLNFFDNAAFSTSYTVNDGGIAQAIVNVLTKVVGWNTNSIHIQGVPQNFVKFAAGAFTDILSANQSNQSVIDTVSKVVGTDGVVNGTSTNTNNIEFKGNQTAKAVDAPDGGVGVQINATRAVAFETHPLAGGKENFPGPHPSNPVTSLDLINEDVYYCSAPFSYITMGNSKIANNAKQWLAHNPNSNSSDGRLLLVTNQATNRVVALRTTSVPQRPNSNAVKGAAPYNPDANYLQCHPSVVAYLNGTISDPKIWKATNSKANTPNSVDITFEWAGNAQIKAGKQQNINPNNANSYYGYGPTKATNPNALNDALNKLVYNLIGQIGDKYTQNIYASKGLTRINPGQYGKHNGSFDCSGLAYWAYGTIGITLGTGSDTTGECGPVTQSQRPDGSYVWDGGGDPAVYGQWIPNSQQPQRGDLIFWQVPSDGGTTPQHVSILITNFGDPGPKGTKWEGTPGSSDVAYTIESSTDGGGSINSAQYLGPGNLGPNVQPISWTKIAFGNQQSWGAVYQNNLQQSLGAQYIGARRPITKHHSWGQTSNQNYNPIVSVNNTNGSTTSNAGANQYDMTTVAGRSSISLTDAYNTQFQTPNYNTTASIIQGNPQAFILDNPVMQDLQQIVGAGVRCFQSAPNGDFIAWFPDYYGVYGTQPSLDISPVEIMDFQIYHDDTQLVTHVAVVGDTTGIGQQVSSVDQMVTQGVVSIQDVTTMQILFGQNTGNVKTLAQNEKTVTSFLNRYGIRPSVTQQSVIHTNALEYIYALHTFMESWVRQFISTVSLTFMPELYPGMRISITIDNEDGGVDNYQFYVTAVQHQGDRSGGFTTTASLTAPIKNGVIMNYGLNFVS